MSYSVKSLKDGTYCAIGVLSYADAVNLAVKTAKDNVSISTVVNEDDSTVLCKAYGYANLGIQVVLTGEKDNVRV